MGVTYEDYLNQVLFEEKKRNIEVVAIVCQKKDIYCRTQDGIPVLCKEEIIDLCFDFVVVLSRFYFHEIKEEIISLGIDPVRIIDGTVMSLPRFDFGKYFNLMENPVSIFANTCLGGRIYKRLMLRFDSPLVNTSWRRINDYIEFVKNPRISLEAPLELYEEGDFYKGKHPVGKLNLESGKELLINFPHSLSFFEAKTEWDRRKKRVNYENCFAVMFLPNNIEKETANKCIEEFQKLKCKKVLFYFTKDSIRDCVSSKRFLWYSHEVAKASDFGVNYDYNDYVLEQYFYDVDMLTLLTDGSVSESVRIV